MKTVFLIITTILTINLTSQVGYDVTIWNVQAGIEDMMIYNPETETLTATVTIQFDGKEFEKNVEVEGQDWETVTYQSLGLTYEEMPASSGAIKANVMVAAGGQGIFGDEYFISVRNRMQPYDVGIQELGDRVNIYGTIVDDVIFWIDFNGYNYVIRSHNEGNGIYLSHWIMDMEGSTERLGYYKGFKDCEGEELIQRHSIGWSVQDADEDAYMEFYSMVIDGCVENWEHPTEATLVVFTYEAGMHLKGKTYSLLEDTNDFGGNYFPSEKLSLHPKLLKQAEDTWEVYIME